MKDRERPDWLREVDHTGDAGILVTAPDLRTLFERAALGMFALVVDVDSVRTTEERRVEVDGSDRDDLLVRWLSDLNFIHLTEQMVLGAFRIDEMSDTHLSASVQGERIDPQRHTIYTEVKAVTFHGLRIEEDGGVWTAQVIFDM